MHIVFYYERLIKLSPIVSEYNMETGQALREVQAAKQGFVCKQWICKNVFKQHVNEFKQTFVIFLLLSFKKADEKDAIKPPQAFVIPMMNISSI